MLKAGLLTLHEDEDAALVVFTEVIDRFGDLPASSPHVDPAVARDGGNGAGDAARDPRGGTGLTGRGSRQAEEGLSIA